jgi:hypothetical protein
LAVYYQPQLLIGSPQVCVPALVHGSIRAGLLGAADFIPLAEEGIPRRRRVARMRAIASAGRHATLISPSISRTGLPSGRSCGRNRPPQWGLDLRCPESRSPRVRPCRR